MSAKQKQENPRWREGVERMEKEPHGLTTKESWERRILSRAFVIMEKSADLDRCISSRVADFVGPIPTAVGSNDDCSNPSSFDAVMTMILSRIEANIDSASGEFSRL